MEKAEGEQRIKSKTSERLVLGANPDYGSLALVLKDSEEPPRSAGGQSTRVSTWCQDIAGARLGLVFALHSHPHSPPPRSLQLPGPWGTKLRFLCVFVL